MVNRNQAPAIHSIKKLFIPPTNIYAFENETTVCEVNLGSQDILKIEVVHKAGRSTEYQRLVSRATASLLKEGTSNKSSAAIAEEIDFYGSSIKTASNMDFAYTTVYCLLKYADQALAMVHELYTSPSFPEEEIEKFKKLNIQKLHDELSKNEVLTYRQLTEEIFGKNHPYGYNSTEADYMDIDRTSILQHFNDFYGTDNCYIFVSGKITDAVRRKIQNYFGQTSKLSVKKQYTPVTVSHEGRTIHLYSKNEHQSALKTGFRLFNNTHPDNAAFFVLNTIYGGYFGSRLMTSIREKSGLTYDIFSNMDQMLHDGCFYVSTEAATEYIPKIFDEIYHQMDRLRQKKVKKGELEMVKNYLTGNFMNMLDGPMNVASFAKTMVLTDKKPEDFNTFFNEIKSIDALHILDTAQKYFIKEKMIEVIVSPEQ